MKSHSLPSLLGIAAVLVAALVVAIAFGVSTGSPTAHAQATVDYDTDDDGLIEIKSRAQLEAVALDPGGTGLFGSGNATYDAAFPNPVGEMGCGDTDSNNEPGPCTGYELTADLALSDWTPIARYTAMLDGNGHTLTVTINSVIGGRFGLFDTLDSDAKVTNLGLDLDITVSTTTDTGLAAVVVGGLAAGIAGTASTTKSYVTGSITVTGGAGTIEAGGLVGDKGGSGPITASYADVTVTINGSDGINAGGLVGLSAGAGTIAASYATGDVSATATSTGAVNAGGLVGDSGAPITASYATGDVSAENTGSPSGGAATAGGLVGNATGAITASYSIGEVTATVAATGVTATEGGLAGTGTPAVADSYFTADTAGTSTSAVGVATSTVELQTPEAYGTTTNDDIFANWNVDIDGVTGGDDPWDFGGDWQYPVLKYGGLDPDDQRPDVTLMLSADSVAEGGTVTVKATLDQTSNRPTKVNLTITTGAELSAMSVTVPARSTESETATITAADNDDMGDNDDVTVSGTVPQGSSGADQPDDVMLSITDNDEAAMVEGVRVRTTETLAVVTWSALDGADGYTVQWVASNPRGTPNWDRASSQETTRTSTTVRRLSPDTNYAFRVSATNVANSWSTAVSKSTEGEDDGASPFATMTPTPTPTPVATPIPATTQVGTSTATTLMSSDGTVTLVLPAGSRSEPYQVNFESVTGCSYPGASADVSFTCVTAKIFDTDDMLETDVEFDAAPTIAFHLSAEQVAALGGEFLLAKLHEMGGLMIVTRASSGDSWAALAGTTLTFDDETGGAVLAGWPSRVTTFTAVVSQSVSDAVQEMYGHLLPRPKLTPPTGGPSVPGVALIALLLGGVALLATGWVLTARRDSA